MFYLGKYRTGNNVLTRRAPMQHTGSADFGPLVSWLLSATPPPKAGIQLRDV